MTSCDSRTDTEVVLNSGMRMPIVGYGTYQIPSTSEGMEAMENALQTGYRLLDCASFYNNESMIGKVISKQYRSNLFIVSKVWNDAIYHGPDAVRASCLQSINDLQCGYLDLYLIHWPVPDKHIEAYKTLVQLRKEGLVKDIGVSNYTIEDIQALESAGLPLPSVNQIEISPFLNRTTTINYMRSKGIVPMSYRGLRNATALQDPTILKIAQQLSVTTAQVLGRWLVQNGICHIPKSVHLERMRSNFDLFSFELNPQQMQLLNSLTSTETLEAFRVRHLEKIIGHTPLVGSGDIRFTVE